MKKENKKRVLWRYVFAVAVIVVGLVLSYYQIGGEFLGFRSVAAWLIYVGFIMLVIVTLQLGFNKKRVVDERMEFVAARASRITFVAIILAAFVVMVLDGISKITVSYASFMSYFVCGVILVYLVSYKILLRHY